MDKTTAEGLVEASSKKQIAEAARLLAITLAYLRNGKKVPDLHEIHSSISQSPNVHALIAEGIDEFTKALSFVHSAVSSSTSQIPQNIFQQKFIDMAEVFAQGCELVLQRYKQHEYTLARDYLISLVSDEKAQKTYANWWAPFKRAWFRGEGEKFVSIIRKNRVADRGSLAGKAGIKAALSEYAAGTGKK